MAYGVRVLLKKLEPLLGVAGQDRYLAALDLSILVPFVLPVGEYNGWGEDQGAQKALPLIGNALQDFDSGPGLPGSSFQGEHVAAGLHRLLDSPLLMCPQLWGFSHLSNQAISVLYFPVRKSLMYSARTGRL